MPAPATPRPRRSPASRPYAIAVAIALAIAAWMALRPAPLALGGDNLTLTWGLLADAARQVGEGRLPVWTSGRWGGSPLAGDPVVGALYPPHLAGFAVTRFPHRRALDVDVAIHLAWLAAGMVFWLRGLGAAPWVAVLGVALLISNPSLVVMAKSWVQYWAAFAWWPWLFGAAARLAAAPGPGLVALAAVALAAQVYAGYAEFALYSGCAALASLVAAGATSAGANGAEAGSRGVATPRSRPGLARRAALAAAVGAAALALAAPQIVPALALARESIRGGAEGAALLAAMGRMPVLPANWLESVSPLPMNDLAPFRIAPSLLVLAAVGAATRGRVGRALGVVALASALLAAGVLHETLRALPGFGFFPAARKLWFLLVFALVSLAAIGAQGASALPVPARRAAIALLVAAAVPSLRALFPAAWPLPAIAGTVAVLLPARRLAGALAAIALAASAATFAATQPLAVRHAFGPGRWAPLLDAALPDGFEGRRFARSLAISDVYEPRQVGLDFGGLFDQPSWNGVGPLAQRRQIEVLERIELSAVPGLAQQIGASPVVVRAGGPLERDLVAAGFRGPEPRAGLRALFAPAVAPRFQLVPQVRMVARAEALRAARQGAALGPGPVLIERADGRRGAAGDADDAPPPGDAAGRLEVESAAADRAVLAVAVDRPTWLLVRDAYFPSWRATIDGTPVDIRPAGGFLMAIEVPAGGHEVVLAVREPGLDRAVAAAALAAAVLAAATIAGRRLRAPRGDQPSRAGSVASKA